MISAKELREKVEQLKKFEEEQKKVEQEQKLKEELTYVEKCINEVQKTLKPTDTYIEIPSKLSSEVQKELSKIGYWIDRGFDNTTRLHFIEPIGKEKYYIDCILNEDLKKHYSTNNITMKNKLTNNNEENSKIKLNIDENINIDEEILETFKKIIEEISNRKIFI